MKNILCAFEQLSGLKINFHKSEIFCFGQVKNCENQYMELFGCNPGNFPIRYLGIPIHYRRLSNNDWTKVLERIEKRLSRWKGKKPLNQWSTDFNQFGPQQYTDVHDVLLRDPERGP